MFCSQMRVDFVLIPSTTGKGYIAAVENKNFTPTVSYGGGSVMVWGGIGLGVRTQLVVVNGALNADGYIRDACSKSMSYHSHPTS